MVTTEEIKALRDETGLSIMQCKKALEDAEGDKEKALKLLKERGADIAESKGGRTLGSGVVTSYIHSNGNVGVLLELACETDFVAKNPEFKAIAYDIAMHIAAMNPEDSKELLEQSFIKDSSKTIEDLVNGAVQKFGERTEVGRFTRYSI
ncbi:MAG: elongation factor Ts [Parcubacteria group bacterium]